MFVYVLAAFLFGIGIASVFSPGLLLWVVIGVVGGSIYFIRGRRGIIFLILVALSFGAGVLRYALAEKSSTLQAFIGQEITMEGYVDSGQNPTKSGATYYFRVLGMNGERVDERVLVQTELWPELAFGTPLTVRGTIELPWEGKEFDYRSYLKKNGVRTVVDQPRLEQVSVINVPLWRRVGLEVRRQLFIVRNLMESGVQMSMPEPASAYINGILLGIRDDLPADLEESFSRTGTTHVLAISGFNVAIIAQGFLLLCLRFTERKRAIWIAIFGIAAFALLTGAEASVVRAAIMGGIVLVAQAWGRDIDAMILVLVAAVSMVLVNPYLLRFDIGFQLSFVAVLGLVYLAPWIESAVQAPKKLREMWQLASATGAANIATLPLILFHFGTLPIYSLPANILILPIVPYAMAWGALAGVVSLVVPTVSGVVGIPAWALSVWQLTIVEFFGALPGATIDLSLSFWMAVAAYGLLVILFFIYGDRRGDNSIT